VTGVMLALPPRRLRKPIEVDLDCCAKTTRLMSWSGRTPAAPAWRGGVLPAKVEA
jgi:hypothetical protein